MGYLGSLFQYALQFEDRAQPPSDKLISLSAFMYGTENAEMWILVFRPYCNVEINLMPKLTKTSKGVMLYFKTVSTALHQGQGTSYANKGDTMVRISGI